MGFRSTLTTEHYGVNLPQWFKDKYKDYLLFPEGTLLSSSVEFKLDSGNELFDDYQKALIEIGVLDNDFKVNCVVLAEDGQVTKVIISEKEVKYIYMDEGNDSNGVWLG